LVEEELDKAKEECKHYKQIDNSIKRKLSEFDLDNKRLEGANIDKDYQLKATKHQL
jgi:hypothetical protein